MSKYGGLGKAGYFAIEDSIMDWAKGSISNAQLRKQVASIGGRVANNRISSSDSTDTIEIDFPNGTSQYGWNKGGVVKKRRKKK